MINVESWFVAEHLSLHGYHCLYEVGTGSELNSEIDKSVYVSEYETILGFFPPFFCNLFFPITYFKVVIVVANYSF